MKTWDDVKSWADMLPGGERAIVLDVLKKTPKERICPYLREIVENGAVQWIYCNAQRERLMEASPTFRETAIPSINDPRYAAKIEAAVLQLFCVDNCRSCISFR